MGRAWSYDANYISENLDKVRVRIGDTDTADQVLSDGEIRYALELASDNVAQAAIIACEFAIAKYAKQPDVTFGPSSVSGSQRSAQYAALKSQLLSRSAFAGVPFAGGISKAGKETYEDDSDRVLPSFRRVTHSMPGEGDRLSDFPDD